MTTWVSRRSVSKPSDLVSQHRHAIHIPIEGFSYANQSQVLKIPNDWIDDGRCIYCGYSRRSIPKLCICPPDQKFNLNYGPAAPSRGTFCKKKDLMKQVAQNTYQIATGVNVLKSAAAESVDNNGTLTNGHPTNLMYGDDTQSINSFFQDSSMTKSSKTANVLPSVYLSKWNPEATKGKFFTSNLDPACTTVYDVFRRGLQMSNGGRCLGWRPSPFRGFFWLTYNEVLVRARHFGSGLISMGLQANTNNLVGIYAKNCVEWGIAEQAIYTYSMVLVPFYEQLGADSKKYILRETSMSVVICGNDETVNKILESEPPHSLQAIVSIRDVKKTTFDRAAAFGIRILKFHDVEEYGSKNLVKDVPPLPQSPAIICFNKISAFGDYLLGHPKGVILSHENIVSCATACVHQLGKYAPAINDVMISYLPLAHMLERCCQVAVLFSGGAIGFYSGDMRLLSDDLKLLKPTIIPAVPRIFNRMYDKIVKRIHSSNLRRTVFNMGLKRKTVQMEKFIIKNNTFWDKLLFSRVKRMLGGRCRLMVVGSAPLAGNILTFLRASLGCIIVEGYGQTECAGCCTLTVHGDYTTEHVGPPIPCSAIKLCDVPELEYFSSIGQGEICIRGSNVFLGYFKDPEKTKYVIDEEGWLHTGDIGQWLPNGCLKIIDRKKHIFKLSQGEYIVPDVIENIYLRSQYVSQAFVHGDSLKSCIVAIIVPNFEELKKWASSRKLPANSFSSLCNHPDVYRLIFNELSRFSQAEHLKYYEMVKEIYLHPDLFSYQNGLLNSAGRIKRKAVEKYFKPQLEDMFARVAV